MLFLFFLLNLFYTNTDEYKILKLTNKQSLRTILRKNKCTAVKLNDDNKEAIGDLLKSNNIKYCYINGVNNVYSLFIISDELEIIKDNNIKPKFILGKVNKSLNNNKYKPTYRNKIYYLLKKFGDKLLQNDINNNGMDAIDEDESNCCKGDSVYLETRIIRDANVIPYEDYKCCRKKTRNNRMNNKPNMNNLTKIDIDKIINLTQCNEATKKLLKESKMQELEKTKDHGFIVKDDEDDDSAVPIAVVDCDNPIKEDTVVFGIVMY